jgi:predicted nucleic acid-binding protein
LISLHQIGQRTLLEALFDEIMELPAVAREVAPSVGLLPLWIRVIRAPALSGLPRPLGPGPRAAIALAVHLAAHYIVVDDAQGRLAAEARGLKPVGSLGLLVRARRRGLIETVRPRMDAMIAAGLYVSPRVYTEILEAAGEPGP